MQLNTIHQSNMQQPQQKQLARSISRQVHWERLEDAYEAHVRSGNRLCTPPDFAMPVPARLAAIAREHERGSMQELAYADGPAFVGPPSPPSSPSLSPPSSPPSSPSTSTSMTDEEEALADAIVTGAYDYHRPRRVAWSAWSADDEALADAILTTAHPCPRST